jgi:NAD(P)-dependent dehydrogenase (short-subunit alcohol dehydrogenase family)
MSVNSNILPAINVLHLTYHLGQPRTRTCILVTSNAAVAARPGQPVYAAAKAAVASLARSLAPDWSPAGIRILAVAPGTVMVDRNRDAVTSRYPDAPLDPGRPGGRLLQPAELAEFIASMLPHADHLTGQLITLDGGSTLPGLK